MTPSTIVTGVGTRLTPFGNVATNHIVAAAQQFGTPVYLYDEALIIERCQALMQMPNAFGLEVRYAMKANPSLALLQTIARQGLGADASSLNEAKRAQRAGISYDRIMLTTQDVPVGNERAELEEMLKAGITYNICSQHQLELLLPFLRQHTAKIAIRVNPGVGAGESVTRNTGDKYSSFGVHLWQLDGIKNLLSRSGMRLEHVHAHIGSGGDPQIWRENIDRMLELLEQHFPDANVVNLGGGFRESRMPDEGAANIQELGEYAKTRLIEFRERTGRALKVAVEPGTFIVANAGYLVASVLDIKSSGPDGFEFVILNAGMEANTRPLLYGSRHPFYVVSARGELLSSEFTLDSATCPVSECVVVGRCCESGDSQTLDDHGHVRPRKLAIPRPGDYVVIGGAGAYCSSMALINYNSYLQAAEVLLHNDTALSLIRKRQTFEQMVTNELPNPTR